MPQSPVFVITGASSGIGAATARRAVEFGHRVVLAARSQEKLEALADELGGPEHAIAVRCDVASWEDQQQLVATALERFGGLDVFFANAGFGGQRGFLKDSVEHWKSMIDTNVYGAALSIRACLPHFKEQNSGHVLLTSSVAGRRVLPGSLYSCTKHAVTAMGEALRQEVHETDIKVTLIEPGMVDTPFFDNRPTGALEADDIARAVMFALTQPPHVDVNEVLIRPVHQPS
jgi:NADP-dependent 3-hydroxy acid dehydrogenase YdfG